MVICRLTMAGTMLTAVAWVIGLGMAQSSYTGLWYRVDSRSDDPKEKIEEAVRGLIEKTSRGRATADDVDPQVLRDIRRVVETYVQYAEELDIEENAKELIVDDGGPRLRIFYLDDREHERQMPDGTRLETKATRAGGRIEIFQESSEGAKIYETYELSKNGKELVLTARLEDEELEAPLVIRSVYTRAD